MKKLVLGILLISSSSTTIAAGNYPSNNWYIGVDYLSFSFPKVEGLAFEPEPAAVSMSLGYKINVHGNFYIVPELRIGTGISDDDISGGGYSFDVEIDRFAALSVRAQYEFNNGIYFFVAPSYGYVEITATEIQLFYDYNESVTDDDWEFGVSTGFGYKFTPRISGEIVFERFDETDVVSVGLNYNF